MHFNRQKFCCFRRELFKSKLFASVLIISLEESWSFVMPPKRAFRNSKSEEEERKFLEKSVPRSTRYVTKWSLKIFAEWQASIMYKTLNELVPDYLQCLFTQRHVNDYNLRKS